VESLAIYALFVSVLVSESDAKPDALKFDFAIVAVGYERRCRWVTKEFAIEAKSGWGLEFGFLADGSYRENRTYFEGLGFKIIGGLRDDAVDLLTGAFLSNDSATASIFVDISSMSREMIANVALAIQRIRSQRVVSITIAYPRIVQELL
jgi:hypothetical protein